MILENIKEALPGMSAMNKKIALYMLEDAQNVGFASIHVLSRAIGVSEVTYYRWRREYGGLKSDQVRRMKDLETENQRLRKAIADLTLDKLILQEAARGN